LSDRIIELRTENSRLKNEVQNLENKILSLVGMINLKSSGGSEGKNVLNEQLINLVISTKQQLNIVSPKIDRFYADEIKKLTQKGIPILIITNDRGGIPKEFQEVYDDLKAMSGVNIINNPNVRYLLVFNSEEALYSGGSLVKEELEKSILIVTSIREAAKLRKIAEIFSLMLPSFMRGK
jgi:F420-dependent methylenetetrahydromethanopterin dehydrogenase